MPLTWEARVVEVLIEDVPASIEKIRSLSRNTFICWWVRGKAGARSMRQWGNNGASNRKWRGHRHWDWMKRAKAMTFLIHLFIIYEMRSSLSVTGKILQWLLSVMAIRYSPNNSMNREPSSRPFTAPRIRNLKHPSIDNKAPSFSFQPAENLSGIEVSWQLLLETRK